MVMRSGAVATRKRKRKGDDAAAVKVPNDVWGSVLEYLPWQLWSRVGLLNRSACEELMAKRAEVRLLSIDEDQTPDVLPVLRCFPNLRVLELTLAPRAYHRGDQCNCTFEARTRCGGLVEPRALAETCTRLEYLHISRVVPVDFFNAIGTAFGERLRGIVMHLEEDASCISVFLAAVRNMEYIVSYSGGIRLCAGDFASIARMQSLQVIYWFNECDGISIIPLMRIAPKSLRCFVVGSHCGMTDDGVFALVARCPLLEYLNLGYADGITGTCFSDPDRGVRSLTHLKHLHFVTESNDIEPACMDPENTVEEILGDAPYAAFKQLVIDKGIAYGDDDDTPPLYFILPLVNAAAGVAHDAALVKDTRSPLLPCQSTAALGSPGASMDREVVEASLRRPARRRLLGHFLPSECCRWTLERDKPPRRMTCEAAWLCCKCPLLPSPSDALIIRPGYVSSQVAGVSVDETREGLFMVHKHVISCTQPAPLPPPAPGDIDYAFELEWKAIREANKRRHQSF